jgi:signal peptidase II
VLENQGNSHKIMAKKKSHSIVGWLLGAMVIILIDQLTKIMTVRAFTLGERKAVIPGFFDLTLAYNKGAAFSFLANAGGWQRWFFTVFGLAAAGFIIWLLLRHGGQRLFCTALTLIMGGAVGNVIDRIYRGQVVDFLLVYQGSWFFPAFNVADSAITIGAVLLIVDELIRVRRSK